MDGEAWRKRTLWRAHHRGTKEADMLVGGFGWPTDLAAHIELMIVGALIIIFLIAEPHGMAQLWRVAKEKLRLWPFPH